MKNSIHSFAKMKCLLVFDYSNDIIYTKYNKKFASHINEFAKAQGLISEQDQEQNKDGKISSNIIVQIFSPIVTSQRIMSCQFGNSYTSIQCQDGLNMAFEEYMGYLFISIGREDVTAMKRFLSVCVTIVRYLCGPDVLLLKTNTQASSTVTHLIDSWIYLHNTEQLMLVEAIEQLMVNSELSSAALQALHEAVDKLQSVIDRSKVHALILVQNKFLALYSSRTATTLSATDVLFLILLCNVNNIKHIQNEYEVESDSEDEFYSPSSSPVPPTQVFSAVEESSEQLHMHSYQVLLAGSDFIPKCVPHVVHINPIAEGVNLLLVIEVGNALISAGLYDTFFHLNTIQTVQMQREVETLKPAFENLDTAVKKLTDGLKKAKNSTLELSYKQLLKKWDAMRKKYIEFIKSNSAEALLRAESSTMGLLDTLKELLNLTALDNSVMNSSQVCVKEITSMVREKLETFNEFFKAKALRNFTLGSDSLTINKYLEEFPGLVHFLFVDRTNHRVTTPTLDFTSAETVNLTKKKIWSMIGFSRNHLQEGHLALMWKDTTFNYAYFLWFEDASGSALKPTIFPTNTSKALPQPGIFCGDFYQKLKEACFPKMSASKVRCYELFCIHLGLATPSCVLEHTRRLAATIWELRGHPNHPIDLL